MTRGLGAATLTLFRLVSLGCVVFERVSRLHVGEEEAGGSAVRVLVVLPHAAVTFIGIETG